jgi:DmsE family decaheme c-type cytochrome
MLGRASCRGGGRYVKNSKRIAVDIASSATLSAKTRQGPPANRSRKFMFVMASAVIACGTLTLPHSSRAEDNLTITSVQSALRGNSQITLQVARDDAVVALTSFTQQIDAPVANVAAKADDASIAALKEFSQRIGHEQQSTAARPKVAEAGSLLEFLQQRTSPPPEKAKTPETVKPKYKAAPEATFVDSKVCATCHATLVAEFQKTLMGRIGLTQKGKFDCQNCHGPGSAHVKAGGGRGVGGILSFGETDPRTPEEKNAICLACHQKGDRANWPGSTHESRNLSCTNCHTVMKQVSRKFNLKTAWEPDTCFQCHKDRRAQIYRSSHMPVREGKIVCSDCHNPHGSVTESLLREDSINDTCYKCHAEKRGPFLFEHLPVRENCDNCHDPHGSVNDYSLKIARPRLCLECHNLMNVGVNGLHNTEGGLGQDCQNCHVAIHGSNAPGGNALGR